MKVLWELFIAFFRASNFSFGGGPAMIPIIQNETVHKYQWLTSEDFTNVVAISNSMPAPIATKLAGMIGHRVKGWSGALAAIIGAVLPTALIMIFLGHLLINYADSPALQAMLKGVRPVVVVLLAQSALQMGQSAFKDKATWVLGIAAFAMMLIWPGLNPAFLVVISMILGIFIFKKKFESENISK